MARSPGAMAFFALAWLVVGAAAHGATFTGVGMQPGSSSSAITDLSSDGSVAVGSPAFRFEGGVLTAIPFSTVTNFSALSASGDGAVVGGMSVMGLELWLQPVYWQGGDVVTDLGLPEEPGWEDSGVHSVSDDGTVLAGTLVIMPYGVWPPPEELWWEGFVLGATGFPWVNPCPSQSPGRWLGQEVDALSPDGASLALTWMCLDPMYPDPNDIMIYGSPGESSGATVPP